MKKVLVLLLVCGLSAAQAKTIYVWTGSPSPLSPFGSWNTAARTIQEAIAAGSSGDTVLVTNGVYQVGGITNWPAGGTLTNRLVITNSVRVVSVSGPVLTAIVGGGPMGSAAVRCAYVGTNAQLVGFTLSNGCSKTTGVATKDQAGGAVWCDTGAVVSNCVLVGNKAYSAGGAAYQGAFYCCIFTNNTAYDGGALYRGSASDSTFANNIATNVGGAAYSSTVSRCTITHNKAIQGGGIAFGAASNCTIAVNDGWWSWGGGAYFALVVESELYGNTANVNGGGAAGGTLRNCVIRNNGVNQEGGGAYLSTLKNCTVTENGAAKGGGVSGGTQENCIVYFNTAATGANYWQTDMRFCDTTPDFGVQGCISTNPAFIDASTHNYRLQYGSPCIDRGTNSAGSAAYDLDGYLRPMDGNYDGQAQIDIGAYEYNPSTYDMDGDGMPDGYELTADTDPLSTNTFLAISSFQLESGGTRVEWHGGAVVTQYLERSTVLTSTGLQWQSIFTNAPPTPPSTNYWDTGVAGTSLFYRVRVAR